MLFIYSYLFCGFVLCLFFLGACLINPHAMKKVIYESAKASNMTVDWIVAIWLICYLLLWPVVMIMTILKARG